MSLEGLSANPYVWTALAGLPLGAAFAALSRRARPGRDAEKERARRLNRFLLCAALCVVAMGLAFPFAGAQGLLTIGVPISLSVWGLVFFAGLRFPRSVGIPLLAILTPLLVWMVINLDSAAPRIADVAASTESAAVFRLTNFREGTVLVEAEIEGRRLSAETERPLVALTVRQIRIGDALFFLGADFRYRLIAVRLNGEELWRTESSESLPFPLDFAQQGRIPGILIEDKETEPQAIVGIDAWRLTVSGPDRYELVSP